MAEVHAVVRTDRLTGTDDRARLISVRYQPEGEMTDIDNGNLILIGDLEADSRENYKGATPTASSTIEEVALVASPEVLYCTCKGRGLENYYNEAGKISRAYRLHRNDIFSVTAEAFEGTPALHEEVYIGDGTKIAMSGSGEAFGKIIDVNVVGKYTYYAIEVA